MFMVGMRVVCIKEGDWTGGWRGGGEVHPAKGDVLTIRDITVEEDGAYLRFEEIRNPRYRFGDGEFEARYWGTRFRPLIERKTDIGFAYEILRKASKKKPVPVKAFESSSWFGG